MNFLSDNAYGAAPEIAEAIAAACTGTSLPYGQDALTARVEQRLADIFEHELAIFPVVTGTAANALALASLTPPYGAVFCHEESHIAVDECAAPEFFTGGAKLAHIAGEHAKLTPASVEAALARFRGGVHSPRPAVISMSQPTERGTVYTAREISALSELARREGLMLHMDGARFANAIVHLGCTPAEITWKAGVDALSFGASKNGALCAEAVIFFDRTRAEEFAYRRKRAGHLVSKMRFISAQLDAYLEQDRWLAYARRANGLAQRMAEGLVRTGVKLADPVEANEIFARLPDGLVKMLRGAGAQFYDWETSRNGYTLVRLVLSCLTPEEDVARFVELLGS